MTINMITHGQRRVIGFIEKNLSIRFDGKTKAEAQEFISKYIDESKQKSNNYTYSRNQTTNGTPKLFYTQYDIDKEMSEDSYYGDMPILG